jgi:tripartite-type tricarboxylate transporter receptor subunit TctC
MDKAMSKTERTSGKRYAAMLALLALAVLLPSITLAQNFPQNRAITLVVPFAPGGGTDAIARDMARYLQDKLGQTVVVDNRGGAGGTIAAQQVSRAAPDGHTLLFVTSTFVTAAATDRKLPYDVLKDFSPIAMLGRGPLLLVLNKDLGLKTVPAFIDRLKSKPGALNFVSSGTGSITHLAAELFMQRTDTKMTHLPYRGSGPAVLDLLSGQGQVFFATVPTILGQVQGNAVQLVAATSKERSTLFPEIPTVMQAGVRDYDVGTWWGIVGPPGLPPPIAAALNQAINEAAASEVLKKRFSDEGADPFRGSPTDFQAMLDAELNGWRKVVQESGLKLE